MQDKYTRQIALEDEAVHLGQHKYEEVLLKALQAEQASLTKPVTELIKTCIEPMVVSIAKEKLNTRGRNSEIMDVLSKFDNYTLAFETARVMFDSYRSTQNIVSLAIRIAESLLADLNYKEFLTTEYKWDAPDGTTKIIKGKSYVENVVATKRKQGTQKAEIMTILRTMMTDRGVLATRYSKELKMRIGMKLLNSMVEATGLFTVGSDRKGQKVLETLPEVLEWIEARNSVLSILSPVMLPMIVKPTDWEGLHGGGYLSAHKGLKLGLVRGSRGSIKALRGHDMKNVYKAVNAIQATPWKINTAILEVAQYIWDNSIEAADMPSREPKDIPAKPWGILDDEEWRVYKEQHHEVVAEWKELARNAHNDNATSTSKRLAARSKLWLADKFKDEEEIYYTCFLDWRGRIYFVQSDVSPQSDDLGKALIHFANGKELGESGAKWLAIHGANCAGVDKVSFEDRIKWVNDNESQILATAEDPLSTMYWWGDELGADKPFGFLAFCFEWAGYKREGNAFKSHIPVALDGSCNGIQHLSAMLHDPRGASAVNIIPSDKPSDIYQEVANEVNIAMSDDIVSGVPEAVALTGKVNRSIVKRNVMTTPYGATKRGMVDQLIEDHKLPRPLASYLAKLNYDAIGNVVVASRLAMGWLQDTAKVLADHNLPMQWETPSGFRVFHAYNKSEDKRIETFWGSLGLKLTIRKDIPDTIAKAKQASGIAPNVVHSYDAAHLQNTVCACIDQGIEAFAMIHDSFGTYASDTDALAMILRQEFVAMYKGDALADFACQIKAQVSPEIYADVPPPPAQGTLDVSTVLTSPYFFA